MGNKKKRVIASILAISILLQAANPMAVYADLPDAATNTSWLSRHWPFGKSKQTEKPEVTFEQQWMQQAVNNARFVQTLMNLTGLAFSEAIMAMQYSKPAVSPEPVSFLRSFWGGTKSVLFNMFFGGTAIIPPLLFMTLYGWASQRWNSFQTRKELGDAGKVITPLEARQNFLQLAAGHKGQEEAKDKLLNVGVYLAHCSLNRTSVRKLIFEIGPPGTGKTTLVETMALTLGCGFFYVGASYVDPGSNRSVIDQIFGPRIKRMNNSECFEDSPVMKFLRATEGQPLRIVAINEFDKLSEKDKKLLLEFLRNAYDNGYAYINGEKINLENVVWVLTSNEEDNTLFGSSSLMSRFEIIKFARLSLQNYIEILQPPFAILANDFANGHNVHINFGNTILDIAQRLDAGDTGARGVQAYVNTLTSRLLNYIYSSENVNRVANKWPIYINVSYDGENDNFIIEAAKDPEPGEKLEGSESKNNGEDTEQESPENINNKAESEAEAVLTQKELDDLRNAMKEFADKEKDKIKN